MVAISHLSFKELQHIVDHLEKILNHPINEKNQRTYDNIKDMKKMKK
jgi:hypothetical protein